MNLKKIIAILAFQLPTFLNAQSNTTPYFGQPNPENTPKVFAPEMVSKKGRLEHGISFSSNIEEMVFGVLKEDGSCGHILYTTVENQQWGSPKAFKPLENECTYLPYLTPNNNSILFAKNKKGSNDGTTDIWKIKKEHHHWALPERIENPISSLSREASACMTENNTIYFSSNRNCEGKENCYTADLFYSKLENGTYSKAQPITEFASPNDEESVFISPKEDYIIFCRYTDQKTWMDLYISYRDIEDTWTTPKIIDSTINSKYWDRRPFVSYDNQFLFFTRLEMNENGLQESDIYWVNTSRLFKPFVYHKIPEINTEVNRKFRFHIPKDYFKDIDDHGLQITFENPELEWLTFNTKKMILKGTPKESGTFKLILTATDRFSNITSSIINLKIEESK